MTQLLLNGLAMGAVYALVALGFVLIYKSVHMLNFAQGEFLMAGSFMGVFLATRNDIPLIVSFAVVIVFGVAMGWAFQRIAYFPLRNRPLITGIIATVGAGIVMRNVALLTLGPGPFALMPLAPVSPIHLGGVTVAPLQLVIIAISLLLFAALAFFFKRTDFGRMMLATAQDQEAARILGIPVNKTIAATYMIAAALAVSAGFMVTPFFYATPEMGLPILLKAFAAAIIGGFGSLLGAVIGGLIIGVLEIFTAFYGSSSYKDAVAFVLLIGFLYLRPSGILGGRVADRV